jgi:hypothetical protein
LFDEKADRTDFIAAVGGAGTAMGAATILKNRNLFNRSSAVALHKNPHAPVVRAPFQYPFSPSSVSSNLFK